MRAALLLGLMVVGAAPAGAQDAPTPDPSPSPPAAGAKEPDEDPAVRVAYRDHRLEIASRDGNYLVHIQWRLQFRYSDPFDDDPQTPDEFMAPGGSSFEVRRGRLKVGGHAYRPWIDYYLEYDFPGNSLLDWRFTLKRIPELQLRVGQWKANFNRERVASSGEQQFVDRSIVNEVFTIDRQQGLMLMGHVFRGSPFEAWYHAGVFTGMGRGGGANDDQRMMWLGRYQWNFLGRDLDPEEGDLERSPRPVAAIAGAVVGNRSPFTRFSTSGGGELPGFGAGTPGRYDVDQWLLESGFKYRGASFQGESHWKTIDDRTTGLTTRLRGGYAQAGYFFHGLVPAFPRPLELAGRFAWVDSDTESPRDTRHEYTLVANWFFAGHKNKLSLDVSRLDLEQLDAPDLVRHRVRLQWDVSF